MSSIPKVSIFTAVKNGERFLVDTIESVLNQTFKDWEHVVVDGASTDRTVELLKNYQHMKWISEPDNSAAEGYHKALSMCRGDYLFQCCVSDGFLDNKWFETCVNILEKHPDVSMVYGFPQYMSEDGHLGKIAYSEFFDCPPPQKEDFLPFWLSTRFMYPEGNYCVRRKVFISCFPDPSSMDFFDVIHPFLKFVYNFNTRGYLPIFTPLIANYGRVHANWLSEQNEEIIAKVMKTIDMYIKGVDEYKALIMHNQIRHVFRDGEGRAIREVSEGELKNYERLVRHYRKTYPFYFGDAVSSQTRVLNRFKAGIASVVRRLQ